MERFVFCKLVEIANQHFTHLGSDLRRIEIGVVEDHFGGRIHDFGRDPRCQAQLTFDFRLKCSSAWRTFPATI